MKPIITLFALLTAITVGASDVTKFSAPHHEEHVDTVLRTNVNATPLVGEFWTEWLRETNDVPNPHRMFPDAQPQWWSVITTGTAWAMCVTNGLWLPHCEQEHINRADQIQTKYVSSNLVAHVAWRGKTNAMYLEVVPVTNIVRHCHFDKVKVWDDGKAGW